MSHTQYLSVMVGSTNVLAVHTIANVRLALNLALLCG